MITPSIDFRAQFELARNKDKIEQRIISVLKQIQYDVSIGKLERIGVIIVLGTFEQTDGVAYGMVQMKPSRNPIESYVNISDSKAIDIVMEFSNFPHDGALVIERSGQILGAGVYLDIEHTTIEIPEGCGTRHKAAASFSIGENINAVFTLSEETNIVRVWKNGEPVETLTQ